MTARPMARIAPAMGSNPIQVVDSRGGTCEQNKQTASTVSMQADQHEIISIKSTSSDDDEQRDRVSTHCDIWRRYIPRKQPSSMAREVANRVMLRQRVQRISTIRAVLGVRRKGRPRRSRAGVRSDVSVPAVLERANELLDPDDRHTAEELGGVVGLLQIAAGGTQLEAAVSSASGLDGVRRVMGSPLRCSEGADERGGECARD